MRNFSVFLALLVASAVATTSAAAQLTPSTPVAAPTAPVSAAQPSAMQSSATQQSATRADAEKDPILQAMLVELDRNRQRLELKDSAKPYFFEFRIDDVVEYNANAAWGALTGEHESHSRMARVRVRVGDYKFDNSHAKVDNQFMAIMERFGLGGDGMIAIEVLDNDPMALRYALWTAADTAYKMALDDLAKKQAELKTVQTPPEANSFSQEKPVIYFEEPRRLELDRDFWKKQIADGSGVIFTDPAAKVFAPEIENSTGQIKGWVRTSYLVNSEGSIVRTGDSDYTAQVAFEAQAADGMRLQRSYPLAEVESKNLGTAEHFQKGVLHALQGLDELIHAPVVDDDYHGPILLKGNAAATSMLDLLGKAVEAHQPSMGSTARTTGAFASAFQTRVLPEFLSVVDDPTLTTFDGKKLIGAYHVDDEGVLAQRTELVKDGKLVGYLLGREPIKDFPQSNGHGRADSGRAPEPHIGVLKVEAANGLSDEDLEKKLIDLGKDQGLSFVYIVDTISGSTSPRTMYRVNVTDGKRQIVRGAKLGDFNLRALRKSIVAAGNKPYVRSEFAGPHSTLIVPPLLFDDVEVKRGEEKDAKLPYYPPPAE
jgi:predicted Zn-dependent protease